MNDDINRDHERRDSIIGKCFGSDSYLNDYKTFKCLDYTAIKQLQVENFLDLEECQNSSPAIKEFIEFVSRWSACTVHGYVIGIGRPDYRVSFEGIECVDYNTLNDIDFIREFSNMFCHADGFEISETKAYCWYD